MDRTVDRDLVIFNSKISNIQCYDNLPHSSIPCLVMNNKTQDGKLNNLSDRYDKINSYPAVPLGLPVLIPERIINGIDPLIELVSEKRKWTNDRERLIFANIKNPRRKHVSKIGKLTPLPIGMAKLADHISRDPDPYFTGDYNWYYTDGNLRRIEGENFNLLASSQYSMPGVIMLHSLRPNEKFNHCLSLSENEYSINTGFRQPVLQISSCNKFVASRQKNAACLFYVESDDELKSDKCHRYETNTSIVSISIAPSNIPEYCTLAAPNTLKVWVPSWKNVTRTQGAIEEFNHCDSWGNVKYLSENSVLLVNRDFVCLKDLRYKLNKKNGISWSKKLVEPCEDICNSVLSKQSDKKCFISTTHQLLELDFRKTFSKRWTHMMDYPPSLGFAVSFCGSDEVVVIGSQCSEEVCCILSNSTNTPYHLPSPNDTLLTCRLKGICLDPSLKSRCNLSTSGLTSFCFGDDFYLLRQTIVGDLFYQRISMNQDLDDQLELRDLQFWEDQCRRKYDTLSSSTLSVSNEYNFTEQFKFINNKKQKDEKLIKFNRSLPEKTSWNISKKQMLKSKGSFFECLLDVWEIEDEPEWSDSKPDDINATISTEEPGYKVSGWLNDMLGLSQDVSIIAEDMSSTEDL